MSVTCQDIMNIMEELAPSQLAEDWDNVGLTLGEPQREVKKILVALDVIPAVIEEAIAEGADMIITHHPMLLFQKVKNIRSDTPLGSVIYDLIRHHISAFCAHTNLDIAFGGTNDVLGELAGLTNLEILEETGAEKLKKLVVYVPLSHEEVVRDAMCLAGAGHIGRYSHCTFGTEGQGTFLPLDGTHPYLGSEGVLEKVEEVRLETIVTEKISAKVISVMMAAHPYEEVAFDLYPVEQKINRVGIGRIGDLKESMSFGEYALLLKEKLGLSSIRLVGEKDKMIQRVGLCSGSGVEFMEAAKRKGADAYITGDIKFHEAQKALELGLCVADATHYASEVLIVPVLQKYIKQKAMDRGWELEVICSQVNGQTFWNR